MSEVITSPEQIRRSTLFGFMLEVLRSPYIMPQEVGDSTASLIEIANSSQRWGNGELISQDEREHIAAMHVLRGVVDSLVARRRLAIPKPLVNGAAHIYAAAEPPFEGLDMDFGVRFNARVFRDTFRACRSGSDAATPAAQIAQEVWQRRGTIREEFFDPLDVEMALMVQDVTGVTTDPVKDIQIGLNNDIITGYALPETPTTAFDIPFYAQYLTGRDSAKEVLEAFIEDTAEINTRLMQS